MWKRGEIAPKEQFLLFPTIFLVYLYFNESNYIFFCEMWLFELSIFLKSAHLICRDTDISKYFRKSLGLRDNESRLYLVICVCFGKVRLKVKWFLFLQKKNNPVFNSHSIGFDQMPPSSGCTIFAIIPFMGPHRERDA